MRHRVEIILPFKPSTAKLTVACGQDFSATFAVGPEISAR
jgi:hypothetical protein